MPRKKPKVEPWEGWGLRVGGPRPYMAWLFSDEQQPVLDAATESYHKVIRAVVIPKERYEELLKAEKKLAKEKADAQGTSGPKGIRAASRVARNRKKKADAQDK